MSVFKKGPDYIDAAWLSRASGQPCYNLDTYMMGEDGVATSFFARVTGSDGAFVEGNRGLYDGMDIEGQHSSAALARLLGLAVFLVLDCTKSTRTMAALLKGCQVLEPETAIRGVILNRVGTARHESIVRESIEKYCGVPVLGAIPRVKELDFYERHLGLLPPEEHAAEGDILERLGRLVEKYVDHRALWDLAERDAPPAETMKAGSPEGKGAVAGRKSFAGLRIGVIRDASFHFYYPENLDALREQGVEILEIRAAEETALPPLDGLYIGGGFPESHARQLAENEPFLESLRRAVDRGLPVYAECGGALYLGRGLEVGDRYYRFAGVFPVVFRLHAKPQGHGYTLLEVDGENPFFPKGGQLKGHEFHYAGVSRWESDDLRFACKVKRGYGFDGHREGLWSRNAYASFSHLHAVGSSRWVDRFLTGVVGAA